MCVPMDDECVCVKLIAMRMGENELLVSCNRGFVMLVCEESESCLKKSVWKEKYALWVKERMKQR